MLGGGLTAGRSSTDHMTWWPPPTVECCTLRTWATTASAASPVRHGPVACAAASALSNLGPNLARTSARPDRRVRGGCAVELKVVYEGRNVSQKQFVTTYAGRQKRVAPNSVVPAVVAPFFGPMSLALSPDGAHRFAHGRRADCCHIAPLTRAVHHRADVCAEKRLFVMEAQGRRVRMIETSGALRS